MLDAPARPLAACGSGDGRRRWHVIEKAVVLVEHQQQCGAAPYLWVGGERIQHACGVGRALRWTGGIRMFAAGRIGNDETHRWQLPAQHIGAQLLDTARADATRAQLRIVPGRSSEGLPKRRKARQRVVGEVVAHVLIDLPGHAGVL